MIRRSSNRHVSWAALWPLLALLGCRDIQPAPSRDNTSSLETAAREAGVIADSDLVDPMGSYARRHENGLHEICIGTEREKSHGFGMIADLGQGLSCQGKGRVSGSDGRLRFVFDSHPQCAIDARYDGQGIRLSGKVPPQCAALCSARATFAGLSVLRSGWSREDAKQVRARHDAKGVWEGDPLCG